MKEKKRIKILYHLMQGIPSGGSDTCLFLLLKQLDQSRFEPFLIYKNKNHLVKKLEDVGIHLIPFNNTNNTNSPQVKNNITKISDTTIEGKPSELRKLISGLKNIFKKTPEILRFIYLITKYQIDIVHTNHYLTGDRMMLLAAIILRKKIISHNRGLYSPDLIDRFISKFIDQIISMSDFSSSVYIKCGVSASKCKTIYDGIDIETFNPSTEGNEKMIIGCFGRLEKWKGQQVLIEAAVSVIKIIPGALFLIVGDGPNENKLKLQVEKLNLGRYFEFTGGVTNVKNYMEKCNIIVHTSIEPEPFGMVIIEAMALEKPVIATKIGGPLEIIEHEVDGFLIPPGNPQILADYIIRLANDTELRAQIGVEARKKVIAKFDVKKYVKEIETVYDNLF
jgi:glycosyltransferase involved in cell wall biosynthesis